MTQCCKNESKSECKNVKIHAKKTNSFATYFSEMKFENRFNCLLIFFFHSQTENILMNTVIVRKLNVRNRENAEI